MSDVISRADAIDAVCRTRCGDKAKGCPAHSCLVIEEFDAIPSADAVDVNDVTIHYKPYPSAEAVNTEKLKHMKFVAIKGDKTEEAYRSGWNGAIDCVIENVSSSDDAEFADLPDIPRAYYERIVGNMAHEINMLKEQIESADAVQGKWIPCSEKLPSEDEIVNITWVNHNPPPYYADIEGKPFVASGLRYRDKWYWYSSVCQDLHQDFDIIDKDIEVIAWQPLPKPYECGAIMKGGDE